MFSPGIARGLLEGLQIIWKKNWKSENKNLKCVLKIMFKAIICNILLYHVKVILIFFIKTV